MFFLTGRNAYSALSKNFIMPMLADDSETIREKAVNAILKIRHGAHLGDFSVRKFLVSTLNYKASHYSDITANLCHEPNFTSKIAYEEIVLYCRRKFEVKNYPNHTQSDERMVKLVTDASYTVCGFDRSDGFIRAGIASRCLISVADIKAHHSQAHL